MRLVVLGCVVREVSREQASTVETHRLRTWLESVEVIEYEDSLFPVSRPKVAATNPPSPGPCST